MRRTKFTYFVEECEKRRLNLRKTDSGSYVIFRQSSVGLLEWEEKTLEGVRKQLASFGAQDTYCQTK